MQTPGVLTVTRSHWLRRILASKPTIACCNRWAWNKNRKYRFPSLNDLWQVIRLAAVSLYGQHVADEASGGTREEQAQHELYRKIS